MNATSNMTITRPTDRELLIERSFDAPRDLVWKAFTEPERLAHWWGPTGWTLPHCTLDLRVGGRWHYCMRGPGGEESWGIATYEEIDAPERLVYRDAFSDADGGVNEAMPQMRTVVEFVEDAGRTTVRSTTTLDSAEQVDTLMEMGMAEGVTQTWDRLEEYLNTNR